MRRIVLYFFLLGILSGLVNASYAEPYQKKITVLSTIKPVQAIVLAIAGKQVISEQLIPDYASPHSYAFKPSDIQKIKRADFIFRIDENFEMMLNPVFANVSDQSKIISLAKSPNIHLLPIASGHNHSHNSKHEGKQGDAKKQSDMHIFTSPSNVLVMAQTITDALSKMEPSKEALYNINLQKFKQAVKRKVEEIKQDLKSVKTSPYFVFHNAWQYFGEYFGLQKPEVLNLHEGITTGVKSIMQSRKEIIADNVHCIFSDPSVSTARVNTLIENLPVKTSRIDILQSEIKLDRFTYLNWLEAMGEDIKACLSTQN